MTSKTDKLKHHHKTPPKNWSLEEGKKTDSEEKIIILLCKFFANIVLQYSVIVNDRQWGNMLFALISRPRFRSDGNRLLNKHYTALHPCLSNGCSAVNGCRQNEGPNS